MSSLLLIVGGVVYVSLVIAVTRLGTKLIARFVPSFREEVVYSLSLVLTAAQYVEWAQAGGQPSDIVIEMSGLAFFASLAVAGLRWPALLAAGWFLHAGWDWALHPMPATAWVPVWFPDLCVGYDVALSFYIIRRAFPALQAVTPRAAALGTALVVLVAGQPAALPSTSITWTMTRRSRRPAKTPISVHRRDPAPCRFRDERRATRIAHSDDHGHVRQVDVDVARQHGCFYGAAERTR